MFSLIKQNDIEQMHFFNDPVSGLKAIIAIHSTKRGPAIGGCRFISYETDESAILDAVRLAKGMSYKAAMAGLPHGGGKAVIMKPTGNFNRRELMRQFGRSLNKLGGDYITAMDSGTETTDMDNIATVTPFVSCTQAAGDPSPHTARGVVAGIKAAVKAQLKTTSLQGLSVAIQGLGHVGYAVAERLAREGMRLIVCDLDPQKTALAEQRLNATVVPTEQIYQAEVDIFCPCGLGAIINSDSLPQLRCSIIAGSANNVLATTEDGDQLARLGILYAPDYVINAGGLIFVANQYAGNSSEHIGQQIDRIGDTLETLFIHAEQIQQPPHRTADLQAQKILDDSTREQAA